MMNRDIFWMEKALMLAKQASECEEVPVGAVIVCGENMVSCAFNNRENGKDATAHAEILAIRRACQALGRWRLEDCEMYVTLEPCPMCAGAIINARLFRVVYGAKDAGGGAFDSVINLRSFPLCSKPIVKGGVLGEQSASLLGAFFEKKRKGKKNSKKF